VLQQFAQMLAAQVRSGDYIARWDSDEFLLVTRPMPNHFVDRIGERLRNAMARHAYDPGDGTALQLTCSIGMAEYSLFRDAERRAGWEQMVELAGAALHWVKQRGRNGWAAFRPGTQTDLASLLRDLHHDPQVLLDSGRAQWLGSPVPPRADDAATRRG
jgi:diguanylate cyclase (GGDEF)-like protein